MSDFVILTKEEFEQEIEFWDPVMVDDDGAQEYIYDLKTANPDVVIRIYSTVDKRTNKTRGIGKDAIRVVYWDARNDRPLGKGKKILRVEGATTIGDRIEARIEDFMAGAPDIDIVNFDYVRAVLEHEAVNWMFFAQSLLDGLDEHEKLTEGQLAYVLGETNPKGKMTFEAHVKAKDPNFYSKYIDDLMYDPDEEVTSREEAADEETPQILKDEGETETYPDQERAPVVEVTEGNGNVPICVETSAYKPYQYPFPTFNPVQSEVFPHITVNENLVIGANTSSGKTICAELIMDYVLSRGQKIIYLSPLKALTQEKYDDWMIRYADKSIVILTGDYTLTDKRKSQLMGANIIVMTSEMMDSRTRKMKAERNFWLRQVGLVVVDESHILATGRGHPVECGIMRFTKINSAARILFLSATMPNVGELAEWLTILNGKRTGVIFSKWRPVYLNMNFMPYRIVRWNSGGEDYWRTQENKRSLAVSIILGKPNEKFLCFVHDKNTGRDMIKRLARKGVTAKFHSADLKMGERLEIESSFQDRENGLRVLVSTSTLAWGRNLPARNVVIVGVHRGIQEVDELDIIQMAGRAGRYGIDDEGHVYLVCPEYTSQHWEDVFENPRPVTSVLNSPPVLAFHTLAEIMNHEIEDPISMLEWFKRSLAFKQRHEFTIDHAMHLIQILFKMEMLTSEVGMTKITELGKVAGLLYFSPYDVYSWYRNFSAIMEGKVQMNDETLSWALTSIPSKEMGYIPKEVEGLCQDFRWTLREMGVDTFEGMPAVFATYLGIIGTPDKDVPPSLRAIQRAVKYDVDRMIEAVKFIDRLYTKWDRSKLWEVLPLRIKYGVSVEVAELTKIKGIGRVRANKLYDKGFKTLDSIANVESKKELAKFLSPKLIREVQESAKTLIKGA